jgi:hypothetical protein
MVSLFFLLLIPSPPPALASVPATATAADQPDSKSKAKPEPKDNEKKRVPKTPTEDKGRQGDQQKTEEKEDKDDGGGFFGSCLGDCFSSLLHSKSEEQATEHALPPPVELTVPAAPPAPTEAALTKGMVAIVVPADSSVQDTQVWDEPAGDAAGRSPVTSLTMGTEVTVHDTWVVQGWRWVEVAVGEAPTPVGWVSGGDLVVRRPEAPLSPVVPIKRADSGSSLLFPFGIRADFTWFSMGPDEVSEEYVQSPWRIGLCGFRRSSGIWQIGMSAGYSHVNGTPRFNYVTSSEIDYPLRSSLRIFDIGLNGGNDFLLGRRWNLYWSAGPTLNWVRESADMAYDLLESGVVVGSGTKKESMERWRWGGDLVLGVGLQQAPGLRMGLALRAFGIDWEPNARESLTLDFVGKRVLLGGSLGFYVGL